MKIPFLPPSRASARTRGCLRIPARGRKRNSALTRSSLRYRSTARAWAPVFVGVGGAGTRAGWQWRAVALSLSAAEDAEKTEKPRVGAGVAIGAPPIARARLRSPSGEPACECVAHGRARGAVSGIVRVRTRDARRARGAARGHAPDREGAGRQVRQRVNR